MVTPSSRTGQLRGYAVLITGGNGGIGLGMARGVAEAGADVAIWGRNTEKNAAAASALRDIGACVHTERCDVSDEDDVEQALAGTVASLGKIDSVVVNAGIPAVPTVPWKVTTEQWRDVLAVDLDGAFFTMRAAARYLVERGEGGALVVVSSTSAVHGAPMTAPYAAAKTALLGLMRSFAVALARHQVRVNAILPGWTDTEMLAGGKRHDRFVEQTIRRTPVRRWGIGTDYAEAAVFLTDPRITFHTGDSLVLDGGYTVF